jgi:hypothetical protein
MRCLFTSFLCANENPQLKIDKLFYKPFPKIKGVKIATHRFADLDMLNFLKLGNSDLVSGL